MECLGKLHNLFRLLYLSTISSTFPLVTIPLTNALLLLYVSVYLFRHNPITSADFDRSASGCQHYLVGIVVAYGAVVAAVWGAYCCGAAALATGWVKPGIAAGAG